MDKIKTTRGILKHPTLSPLPVPITLDPQANKGCIVLGEDGLIYGSQTISDDGIFFWIPMANPAYSSGSGAGADIDIWVKEGAPEPSLMEMLMFPPTAPERAVGTLKKASEYVNAISPGPTTKISVNIGAGLYNPESEWGSPTVFIAWDKDLTGVKHEMLNRFGEVYTSLADAQAGEVPGGIVGLDDNQDHSFYPGGASGYMDLDAYPHFIPFKSVFVSNPTAGISTEFNSLQINSSFSFAGGFHWVGFQEFLKLVYEYYVGLHPTRGALLDLVGPDDLGLGQDAFSPGADNADVFFAAQKVTYVGAADTTALGGITINSAITINAPVGSGVHIKDCTFGALPPTELIRASTIRPGYISITSDCFVNFSNISLVGNTTVTADGSGWTSVSQADSPPLGTLPVNGPGFTYRKFASAFITIDSPRAEINFGASYHVSNLAAIAARNFYYTPSGALLPNHLFALDNNGNIPANDSDGPYVDCLVHAVQGCNFNKFDGFARAPGEERNNTLYSGDYLVNQGIVGKFGSNGYNNSLSRGCIFGLTQGSLANGIEGSFELICTSKGKSAWRKAGVPFSAIDTSFNADDLSSSFPGEASPAGDNIVITNPDPNGLRLASRTWNVGVDVALATLVRVTNSERIYTL